MRGILDDPLFGRLQFRKAAVHVADRVDYGVLGIELDAPATTDGLNRLRLRAKTEK